MDTSNIVDFDSRDGISDGLTDLLREGAQQLIATAVAFCKSTRLARSALICAVSMGCRRGRVR